LKKTRVEYGREVAASLDRMPFYVHLRFKNWLADIELKGLDEARKRPGYHDEPLKGRRIGQRSVRLNRAYRVIYMELRGELIVIVRVLEVTKHDY
jgi:proteic killer suppression protein